MSAFLPKLSQSLVNCTVPLPFILKLYWPIFNLQSLNDFIIRYVIFRAQNLKSPCGKETLDQVHLGIHIRTSQGKTQRILEEAQKKKPGSA